MFQNKGAATAVLWKFSLVVEEVRIDPEPVLSAFIQTHNDSKRQKSDLYSVKNAPSSHLSAVIRNDGWGKAFHCSFRWRNPILEELFPAISLQGNAEITEGSRHQLSISFDDVDKNKLRELSNLCPTLTSPKEQYNFRKRNIDSLSLGPITIEYEMLDEWGRVHHGHIKPHMGDNSRGYIGVTQSGFIHHEEIVVACMSMPDTIYCCVIDADRGPHSKEYNISRTVNPGAAEHFQIVVGANKSAHVSIHLRFNVDTSNVIQSKSFTIELWNPRNQQLHKCFKDGDVARLQLDRNDTSFHYRFDASKLAVFPFTNLETSRFPERSWD
jgi:hypothetical protein